MGYEEFLASKAWAVPTVSVDPAVAINPALFGFQHDVVRWALWPHAVERLTRALDIEVAA